jgi:hypothetical protein
VDAEEIARAKRNISIAGDNKDYALTRAKAPLRPLRILCDLCVKKGTSGSSE